MQDAAALLAAAEADAAARGKAWVRLDTLRAALSALPDVAPPPAAPQPELLDGMPPAEWRLLALRFWRGLQIIVRTHGSSLTLEWAKMQALHYLGKPVAGSMVWELAPQFHIVQPGSAIPPTRLTKLPPVAIKPGESVTIAATRS
jgi:hypothetical protein